MRIQPALPIRRDRPLIGRHPALTADSDLGAMILRMISMNSLAGLTPAIGRKEAPEPARGITPAQAGSGQSAAPQRPLELVPPQPTRPMPRGSLLDLRV